MRKLAVYISILAVTLVAISCAGAAEETTATPGSQAPVDQATAPIPTPEPTATPLPDPAGSALLQWSDEDCIFRPPGELGELTRVTRTYVENEPKQNIDRIFRRFRQSEAESTILRCDMNTAGLFSTWWIQSFSDEQEAQSLFNSLVMATAPEVQKLNDNLRSCALIRPSREGSDGYRLDFVDKNICESSVFNGLSGVQLYGRTVIGIDSQFYEEFFDPLLDHAKAVVDKRTPS